jgi:hypothetical protein
MKKIILLSLLSISINATEYKVEVNKANYNNSVKVEPYVSTEKTSVITCDEPLVPNETGDTCINPIEAVNWINTNGDSCNGMRQSNFNSNIYFSRSKTNNPSNLKIPTGYHWVSRSEYISLFNASNVATKSGNIHPYANQCGISGYPKYEGVNQYLLLFSNGTSGIHAGNYEWHGANSSTNNYTSSNGFLGYILYKD